MTISTMRSYEAWAASLRNFSWLQGAGVPGAQDVDVLIHNGRRGRFLAIESKPFASDFILVPVGQWRTLKDLAQNPSFDVWLVVEPGPSGMYYALDLKIPPAVRYTRHNGQSHVRLNLSVFEYADLSELQDAVKRWWNSDKG